jgi:hypothetical protein
MSGVEVPDVPLSHQPLATRSRQYPCWFLLEWREIIPVALWTSDVGNEAFYSMLHSRRVLVVPPGAEKAVDSIDRLISLHSNLASVVIIFLWGICDPGITKLNPDNAFGECLLYLVQDFMDDFEAPMQMQIAFMNNVTSYIKQLKDTHMFVTHPFSAMALTLMEWCHNQ